MRTSRAPRRGAELAVEHLPRAGAPPPEARPGARCRGGRDAGERPRRPAARAGRVARRPPARVGEDQRRVRPASHQPQHAHHLVELDGPVALGGGAVALDLRRHRRAQAQPAHDDLLGELVETVLDRRVEIADRLEQAEREQRGNGGRSRHGVCAREGSGSITFFPWPSPPPPGARSTPRRCPISTRCTAWRSGSPATPRQAEDLVQDTMLKAYRSWQQYRPGHQRQGLAAHHPAQHLHQRLPPAEARAGGHRPGGGRTARDLSGRGGRRSRGRLLLQDRGREGPRGDRRAAARSSARCWC